MAMDCLNFDQAKERNQSLATVAPIVGSLSKLDVTARERLRRKFDLCFVLAIAIYEFTNLGLSGFVMLLLLLLCNTVQLLKRRLYRGEGVIKELH